MAIVTQTDKRTGITYAYETQYFWDKEEHADNNPLYRFEKWNFTHKHPYCADISSPRNSEFFSSITDEQINKFFKLQGRRRFIFTE